MAAAEESADAMAAALIAEEEEAKLKANAKVAASPTRATMLLRFFMHVNFELKGTLWNDDLMIGM